MKLTSPFLIEKKLICIPDTTGSIEVRIFIVPAEGDHEKIPYARVNHAKYMVTDNSALIGIFYLIFKFESFWKFVKSIVQVILLQFLSKQYLQNHRLSFGEK